MVDRASQFLAACFHAEPARVRVHLLELAGGEDWNWEDVFEAAAAEAMLPALCEQFRTLHLVDSAPAEIGAFLSRVEALNLERNQAILEELKEAVTLVNAAGIEPVLLKGVEYLVTGLYPNAGARYVGDIDLLLPAHQMQAAAEILIAHDFTRDTLDPFEDFRHHYAPLHRAHAVDIELHHSLGPGGCDALLPAGDVIARSLPHCVNGLRVRIPCAEDLLVHLIAHSQIKHPYNQRVWPPLRAMVDLAAMNRRFGTKAVWQTVGKRFAAAGQYGLLALHLVQVKASLGIEFDLELPLTPLTRMRWTHRQILRRWPRLRYADPVYMYCTVFRHRFAMLRKLLVSREGLRHLVRQMTARDNYVRLWTDLSEGYGR